MTSATLYNAEVLGLATSLAQFPLTPDLPLRGSARALTCGSTIQLGLACDETGRIANVGLRAQACAIGQAAAAIFASAATGKDRGELEVAVTEIEQWLAGGALPQWAGVSVIAAARDYPARHGAILLAWRAALVALAVPG
ncbi:MAG: iron-sulfur cluster assembly scaffold protein [Pseudomonadota bacterium]|nr:iron-sulfur cluster assembly scaffold protein [Pseudomonadota bacterium]